MCGSCRDHNIEAQRNYSIFFKAMKPVRQGLDLDLFSSRAHDLFTTSYCLSNILTVIPQMSAILS